MGAGVVMGRMAVVTASLAAMEVALVVGFQVEGGMEEPAGREVDVGWEEWMEGAQCKSLTSMKCRSRRN